VAQFGWTDGKRGSIKNVGKRKGREGHRRDTCKVGENGKKKG